MKTIKSKNIAYKCYGIYNTTNKIIGCIFDTEKEAKTLLDSFGSVAANYEIVIVEPQV